MKKYGIRPFSILWWARLAGMIVLMWAFAVVWLAPGVAQAGELVQLSTDPAQETNLLADSYDYLLEGTGLEGLGNTFAAGEKLYHVNGLFVAAICAHESGWGESRLARECNNLGGIKGGSGYRAFYNKQICVLYMFGLLDRLYIGKGRDSIGEIGAMYCETGGWTGAITSIMNGFIEEAGDTRD